MPNEENTLKKNNVHLSKPKILTLKVHLTVHALDKK